MSKIYVPTALGAQILVTGGLLLLAVGTAVAQVRPAAAPRNSHYTPPAFAQHQGPSDLPLAGPLQAREPQPELADMRPKVSVRHQTPPGVEIKDGKVTITKKKADGPKGAPAKMSESELQKAREGVMGGMEGLMQQQSRMIPGAPSEP